MHLLSPDQDLAARTIRNSVLIGAGLVIGATVHGGPLVADVRSGE